MFSVAVNDVLLTINHYFFSLPFCQNGATYCTSELSILKNNEIHTWDKGYDDDGNQVIFHGLVFHFTLFFVRMM